MNPVMIPETAAMTLNLYVLSQVQRLALKTSHVIGNITIPTYFINKACAAVSINYG